jgi:hypothetical protein
MCYIPSSSVTLKKIEVILQNSIFSLHVNAIGLKFELIVQYSVNPNDMHNIILHTSLDYDDYDIKIFDTEFIAIIYSLLKLICIYT